MRGSRNRPRRGGAHLRFRFPGRQLALASERIRIKPTRRWNWALAVVGGAIWSWIWSVQPPVVEMVDQPIREATLEATNGTTNGESNSTGPVRPVLPQQGLARLVMVADSLASISEDSLDVPTVPADAPPLRNDRQRQTDIPEAVWLSGTIEMDESSDSLTPTFSVEQ